jgi:hypothetical protein
VYRPRGKGGLDFGMCAGSGTGFRSRSGLRSMTALAEAFQLPKVMLLQNLPETEQRIAPSGYLITRNGTDVINNFCRGYRRMKIIAGKKYRSTGLLIYNDSVLLKLT